MAALTSSGVTFGDSTSQTTANNLPANTTNVLNATAGASVGAVGTYAACYNSANNATDTPGATIAGSQLLYSTTQTAGTQSVIRPAGTWRLMGRTIGNVDGVAFYAPSLWLRIS